MTDSSDQRLIALSKFVQNYLSSIEGVQPAIQLQAMAGDASSRRYFYIEHKPNLLAVDSPAGNRQLEFIRIANLLGKHQVKVPRVLAADVQQGYMVVDNIQPSLDYYSQLSQASQPTNKNSASTFLSDLHQSAINSLVNIQQCHQKPEWLPNYDSQLLQQELSLFPQWFMQQLLGLPINRHLAKQIESVDQHLISSALEQPQVLVHRDFHSRNLLRRINSDSHEDQTVIDFQDAVWGPITYDLVSLLRDCYVQYPQTSIARLSQLFAEHCQQQNLLSEQQIESWSRWFDLMGIQRHLKVLGIFSRLYLRDHKPQYLQYLPNIVTNIITVSQQYTALQNLTDYLQTDVTTAMKKQSWYADPASVTATKPTTQQALLHLPIF